MKRYDIAVIGGGVIGLAIAFELKSRDPHLDITLFDKNETGKEASWASVGMLEPQLLSQKDLSLATPIHRLFFELCRHSQQLFESYLYRIENVSGLSCEFRKEGILKIFPSGVSPENVLEWLNELRIPARWLSESDLQQEEPHFRNGLTAIHLTENYQVENRKLAAALHRACVQSGVEIRENNAIRDFNITQGRIQFAEVQKEHVSAGHYVLAAGAWSSQFPSLKGFIPEVLPKRGQIVALQMPGLKYIHHASYVDHFYFVPRNDGRLLVGSTVEDAGFDKQTQPEVIKKFREQLADIVPASSEWKTIDAWAGLRPGSLDSFPYLGPTPIGNLTIATGHFRNGILLTPITAKIVADEILNKKIDPLMEPFLISRFK
ncbi:glycine oxidase ThiO [bacterium]|nr:glycine oxidase ThiO [bacterium]